MTHPLAPSLEEMSRHFGERKLQFIDTTNPPLLYPMLLESEQHVQVLASYKGSRAVPYQVRIHLALDRWFARCDCPDGHDGRCKHVATVLATWRDAPARFVTIPERQLESPWRLVGQMMPQARLFWVWSQVKDEQQHVQALDWLCQSYRQEASVLDCAPTQLAHRFETCLALLEPLVQQQRWSVVVDCLDRWFEHMIEVMDSSAFWARGVERALSWLEQCLLCQSLTSSLRQRTWRTLLRVVFEVPLRACAAQAQDMLLLHRREQDLTPLTLLVRQHMPDEDHPLLFELEAQTISMDLFIERALALAQYDALVRHLVEHQQRERLRALVTSKPTLRFHLIVEACLRAGVASWVIDWVEIGFNSHNTVRLAHWLEQAYADAPERALPMAQFRLQQQPTHEALASVRRLATQLGQWSALRPNTVQWLSAQHHHVLLLRVHTLDAQWDAVWTTIERAKQDGLHHRLSWLQECARTVEPLSNHHPERALVLCSESLHALSTHHPETGRELIAALREQKNRLQAQLGAS